MADSCHGLAKQFIPWKNRPIYWHSVLSFSHAGCIDGVIVVLPPNCHEEANLALLAAEDAVGIPVIPATGGASRQISSSNGLEKLPPHCSHVLIHDAARPFVSAALIRRLCERLKNGLNSVVPGVPAIDTIKLLEDEGSGRIQKGLPRNRLVHIQTPQGFSSRALREAHRLAEKKGLLATDDATLLENAGIATYVVEGERTNIKITNPEDLRYLFNTERQAIPCTGLGYDVHRFGGDRPLKLGGVPIPCKSMIAAHSDGDVLMHALIDAILGCACLGDIGQHFPDSDPRFENISSVILLDETMALCTNLTLCNVDMIAVAQKPKLAPHADAIRKNVARLLGIDLRLVNFKATTEEGLGFTGSCEGIKAWAVVTAMRKLS